MNDLGLKQYRNLANLIIALTRHINLPPIPKGNGELIHAFGAGNGKDATEIGYSFSITESGSRVLSEIVTILRREYYTCYCNRNTLSSNIWRFSFLRDAILVENALLGC